MNHNFLIQVVPRLPPAVDGLGDYALNLAHQLSKVFGIETHFIVGDPIWKGDAHVEVFPVSRIEDRSMRALISLPLLESARAVLLHYVGYGYEKRGCPNWLVNGLECWQKESSERTLITMFHEVYASGAIWTSSFWLSRTQKNLAARLARISKQILTNREGYAKILRHLSGDRERLIPVLPVFSNVGEPDCLPAALAERQRRLAVFGNCGHRQRVFRESLEALKRACHALEIEEILDIGTPVEHGVSQVDGIPVKVIGRLPAHAVSAFLSDSIAGFFNYPADYLGKSTIFAAYCAHRMLPIGIHSTERHADGLRGGQHFWFVDKHDGSWSLAASQTIADHAYQWYQEHNLRRQAEIFAASITAHPQ